MTEDDLQPPSPEATPPSERGPGDEPYRRIISRAVSPREPGGSQALEACPMDMEDLATHFALLPARDLSKAWAGAVIDASTRPFRTGDIARALTIVAVRLHGLEPPRTLAQAFDGEAGNPDLLRPARSRTPRPDRDHSWSSTDRDAVQARREYARTLIESVCRELGHEAAVLFLPTTHGRTFYRQTGQTYHTVRGQVLNIVQSRAVLARSPLRVYDLSNVTGLKPGTISKVLEHFRAEQDHPAP